MRLQQYFWSCANSHTSFGLSRLLSTKTGKLAMLTPFRVSNSGHGPTFRLVTRLETLVNIFGVAFIFDHGQVSAPLLDFARTMVHTIGQRFHLEHKNGQRSHLLEHIVLLSCCSSYNMIHHHKNDPFLAFITSTCTYTCT